MKIETKQLIIILITLIVGVILGSVFFGRTPEKEGLNNSMTTEAHHDIWTCSMHPHIQLEEPGQCPVCGMDLIPLEEETPLFDPNAIQMTETAMKLANVQTVRIGHEEISKQLRLNGKVVADERKIYAQSTHISGRIERLMVNFEGESVRRGQALAEVYSPELVTAQEELLQAYTIKDAQPELFNAAKEKLRNWKIGASQIDRIVTAGKPIERFTITADISGIVTAKKAVLGDYVQRGIPLYEIADLSKLWIVFDVYERDIPWIKIGDEVNYTISSIPGEIVTGKITFIDPVINPKTRVAKARIEVLNKENRLKPEMFVSGVVTNKMTNTNKKELILPKSAIMWTGERSIVYVKQTSGNIHEFVLREVVLGPSLGDSYLVKQGLDVDEEVVVNGTFTVDAAAQLAGKPSMMNPEGGVSINEHNHGTSHIEQKEQLPIVITKETKTALEKIVTQYANVKDALVATDLERTKENIKKFQSTIDQTDMKLFLGEAHIVWMPLEQRLKTHIKAISEKAAIDEVREVFDELSETIIEIATVFGPFSRTLYVQYCPMAKQNNGAYWLSLSNEIRNPYFGDAMLTCGEVKNEIK
ncbi:efflux RND transporter periplasmic adaptor subunit [Leptobacterium sp. I13]|uniref:efflux RND transporter periplasmic adaptor subunit n=1 Tax=Leptobacterium meishanense TaxID=3128904 RepID=UPI0030EC0289